MHWLRNCFCCARPLLWELLQKCDYLGLGGIGYNHRNGSQLHSLLQASSEKKLAAHRRPRLVQYDFRTGHNLLDLEPKNDAWN